MPTTRPCGSTRIGMGRVNAHRTLLALGPHPPTKPSVLDSGRYTTNPNSLSFSWTASSDPESGILLYEYAIGTASDPTSVRSWSNAGTGLDFTAKGLSLSTGETYYVSVRAKNGVQAVSETGVSDGIMYAFATSGPAQHANGTYVYSDAPRPPASRPLLGYRPRPLGGMAVDGLASVGQGEVVTVSDGWRLRAAFAAKDPEVLVLVLPVPGRRITQATLGAEHRRVIPGQEGPEASASARWCGWRAKSAQDFHLDGSGLTGFGGQQGVHLTTAL